MLEYDKIDISEGIDVKKLGENSRECGLCRFYYFKDKNFNYQSYFCDGCHDMSVKAVSIKDLAIVYSGGNAYRTNFSFMSLTEATNLIKSSSMTNKKGTL